MDVVNIVIGLLVGLAAGAVIAWQARRAAAASARAEASAELGALQEQVKGRDAAAAQLRATLSEREGELARERQRVVELSQQAARAEERAARADALTAEVQRAREGAQTADSALADERARLAAAAKELEQLQPLRARTDELDRVAGELRQTIADLQARSAKLVAELEAERKASAEREQLTAQNREQLRAELENLTNRLLEEKGKALLADNKVVLEASLSPLRERIKEFEEKVAKTYDQDNRDRASLFEHLRRLDEAQAKLNKEAATLSKALSGDSKVQGDWGEMILENLLELAGLEEGREYETQESHLSEEGARLRPDVVVYLPGNKAVVVDSKVAITAFVELTRAETDEAREVALDAHVGAVRTHMKSLAGKSYQDVLNGRKLDFQVMFIPSEPAFHAALARAPGLYNEAFNQNIALASPTTLLTTLRVVNLVWQYDKQNSNALQIAEEAGKLLQKFVGFAEDLTEVGQRLDQAQEAYGKAKSKLDTGPGNLAGKAKNLVQLGARLSKAEKVQQYFAQVEGDGAPPALPPASVERPNES